MHRISTRLTATLHILLTLAALPVLAGARYVVRIDGNDARSIHVTASLTPDEGVLWMNDEGDQGLPDGWGGFVADLLVRDGEGATLALGADGLSRWRLTGAPRGPVSVSYRVRLEHDRTPLNFGDNGAAYNRGGAVMWAGRALFLAGASTDDVEVRFELPAGWHVTTPWQALTPATYRPTDTTDLVNSAFMAGRHIEHVVREGELELRLALVGGEVEASRERIAGDLSRYLAYYGRTLGPAPRRSMIVIAADSGYWGGEVMGRAISLSVGGPISDPDPTLAHLFAHEIVHLWGLDINFDRSSEPELYWFYEGMLAEYLSHLANVRLGDIDERAWLDQVGADYSKYRAAREPGLSLAVAGREKAKLYDLIYSGGMIVGAALDLEARGTTGNRLGLEDLVRHLYREFPSDDGSRARPGVPELGVGDLFRVVEELFGASVGRSVQAWIEGKAEIPLPSLLAVAGLRGEELDGGEFRVSRMEAPEASQSAVLEALLAERRR